MHRGLALPNYQEIGPLVNSISHLNKFVFSSPCFESEKFFFPTHMHRAPKEFHSSEREQTTVQFFFNYDKSTGGLIIFPREIVPRGKVLVSSQKEFRNEKEIEKVK